ncbi:MAG: branched-chain amino acid ABC transporter substrate-binding protein [Deltaproteobacteria bacterium]|jgi:branched-chain amino acid transport system substrate-binding protein|nr:branched-chain amino acid ABC transporter substrate-binding protein [Deltaproteobacteria bacterium]
MKSFLKVLAIFALAAWLPLSTAQAQSEDQIRIGFGGALLGNLATYGLSNLYGIEYAIGQINAQGGILGRQIVLVQEDDACDPKAAANAASKLASEGLTLILGHTCSGATRSALSVYGNGALVISSSATEVDLTDDGSHPYFFRTTPRDDAQSKAQVDYIRSKGYTKVAILHDKGDYGQSLAQLAAGFIAAEPGSMTVVLNDGITSGEVSYEEIVSKIRDSGAEVLIWGGYYNDASKLAMQMRDKGVETVIVGPDGLYDQRYIDIGQGAVEGSIVTGQADISQSDAGKAAIEDHKSRHGEETGTYFFYAAGAAQALLAAVEKVGNTTDLDAIKKRLQEDTIETVMGPVRFDAKGDVIGAGYTLFEVKDGKFVALN